MSNLPVFSIKDLIDAGVHFGHKAMRWNPEMAPFIYTTRDGVHIIDLQQTAVLLHRALQEIYAVAKRQGKILFVGTKRQASEHIKEAAQRCGQFYVDKRWLGGTLTNWKTVSKSIKTLEILEKKVNESESGQGLKLSKKETLELTREIEKLEKSLGGIRKMNGMPDLIFAIDTNKENLAIKEAQKLGIPIVAIVDTNCNPHGLTHAVPGNDDATRAIKLYCQLVSDTILSGIEQALISSGVDLKQSRAFAGDEKPEPELSIEEVTGIELTPATEEVVTEIVISEEPKAKKPAAKKAKEEVGEVAAEPKAKKATTKKTKDA